VDSTGNHFVGLQVEEVISLVKTMAKHNWQETTCTSCLKPATSDL
jgi:hypothetical protein